jgi:hypothetical protein
MFFLKLANSPVPLDPSNSAKNSSREGAACFGEDNGEFIELFMFEFCINEVICGGMAKKKASYWNLDW